MLATGIVKLTLHFLRPSNVSRSFAIALIGLFLLTLSGCSKKLLPEDPQLRPIQEMLDAQTPIGMPRANVSLFLDAQGYPLQSSEKPGTLVAIIRKIDTQRLEPVTARVTFYFNSSDKLTSIELQRTLNEPVH